MPDFKEHRSQSSTAKSQAPGVRYNLVIAGALAATAVAMFHGQATELFWDAVSFIAPSGP